MATTKIDYPTAINRLPVIDVRSFGAVGDGVANDTAAIQAAMDSAATTTLTGSAYVQLPRGRFLTTTVLVFKHDGIILQGFGQEGSGGMTGWSPSGANNQAASCLVANNSHDATPMIRINPADGGSTQWYRGTCLRDISIDVSQSTQYTTNSVPPNVIEIRELSNCPSFDNIMVFGHTGTALYVGPNSTFSSGQNISENLIFNNCYFFGGGNGTTQLPKSSGVIVQASDNIKFNGGFIAYNYTGASTLPVNNNTSDFAALQIAPGAINTIGGINVMNNGFWADGLIITNYVVSVRLTALNLNGTNYGCQYCRFTSLVIENYNKAFAINQEIGSNIGFWRSQVWIERCAIGGQFAGYGTNPRQILASNIQGGHIGLQFQNFAGDLSLDSTCTGVFYDIGPNPNGTFFDATDSGGGNAGRYSKPQLPGTIFPGAVRVTGSSGTTPSTTTSAPGGQDIALQCWGQGTKIANSQLNLGASESSVAGQFMTLVAWFDGANWWLGLCVQSGNSPGTAIWKRTQMSGW